MNPIVRTIIILACVAIVFVVVRLLFYKKKTVSVIIAALIIVAILFSVVRNGDDFKKVQRFIDKHNYGTEHEPEEVLNGPNYKHYKDISISNTDIMGMGYCDEEICLYSKKSDFTYANVLGQVQRVGYIVYCEIVFEWNNFGKSDFCAYVGIALQEYPNVIQSRLRVYGFSAGSRPPFSAVETYYGYYEFDREYMEKMASLEAGLLVMQANLFLKANDLPSLY